MADTQFNVGSASLVKEVETKITQAGTQGTDAEALDADGKQPESPVNKTKTELIAMAKHANVDATATRPNATKQIAEQSTPAGREAPKRLATSGTGDARVQRRWAGGGGLPRRGPASLWERSGAGFHSFRHHQSFHWPHRLRIARQRADHQW